MDDGELDDRELDDREHVHVHDQLDSYRAGLLDDVEWVVVRTHLDECDQCCAEEQQADMRQPATEDDYPYESAHTAMSLLHRLRQMPRFRPLPAREFAAADEYYYVQGRNPPGWPIVFGACLVTALVSSGVGYALAAFV